ncbi:GNAT family N-acetyltransferase [Metabacillus indicus]|uniref:GNAT family N-acetyltransferase n=1 Tax=Metabacillus indicus TaxID=246786 RepID=UPI00249222EB|nr:GNAT family N-acetyltransferase [Metabacillus indicus]
MYRKEFFVFENSVPVKAVVRNYEKNDFDSLIQIQKESFPPPFPPDLWWKKEQLEQHVHLFPEGALCIEADGEIAGSMTALRVHFDPAKPHHTWEDITDSGYITRSHKRDGDTLYVVDISVRPKFRKLGLGKWLMFSMYETVVKLNLKRLVGGGRMPGYRQHSDHLTPDEYLEEVVKGSLKDPVLTFLLRCGRTPMSVIPDYLEDDESCNFAALMEWKNPFIR